MLIYEQKGQGLKMMLCIYIYIYIYIQDAKFISFCMLLDIKTNKANMLLKKMQGYSLS